MGKDLLWATWLAASCVSGGGKPGGRKQQGRGGEGRPQLGSRAGSAWAGWECGGAGVPVGPGRAAGGAGGPLGACGAPSSAPPPPGALPQPAVLSTPGIRHPGSSEELRIQATPWPLPGYWGLGHGHAAHSPGAEAASGCWQIELLPRPRSTPVSSAPGAAGDPGPPWPAAIFLATFPPRVTSSSHKDTALAVGPALLQHDLILMPSANATSR